MHSNHVALIIQSLIPPKIDNRNGHGKKKLNKEDQITKHNSTSFYTHMQMKRNHCSAMKAINRATKRIK